MAGVFHQSEGEPNGDGNQSKEGARELLFPPRGGGGFAGRGVASNSVCKGGRRVVPFFTKHGLAILCLRLFPHLGKVLHMQVSTEPRSEKGRNGSFQPRVIYAAGICS